MYILQLENGGHFLLAARKRKKSKCSNYLISLEQGDMARSSPAFCGKVRGNFLGTEFTAYDAGAGPGRASGGARGETSSSAGGLRTTSAVVLPRCTDSEMQHESARLQGSAPARQALPCKQRCIADEGTALIQWHCIAGASQIRTEQAGVLYSYNVMGTQGPRKMTALVPDPTGGRDGAPTVFQPEGDGHELIDRQVALIYNGFLGVGE